MPHGLKRRSPLPRYSPRAMRPQLLDDQRLIHVFFDTHLLDADFFPTHLGSCLESVRDTPYLRPAE